MASSKRGHDATQSAPVYTVYPGGYQENVNPTFQESYPHAPPPKYEDVISGRATGQGLPPQLPETYEGLKPAGIAFIAPVNRYSKMQKSIGLSFTLVFMFCLVIIFIKSL